MIAMTYREKRVLTTDQLATIFGTTHNRIKDNYHENAEHFVEGKHYFTLVGEELKQFKAMLRQVGNPDLPSARQITAGYSAVSLIEALDDDVLNVPIPKINKFTSHLKLWTRHGIARHAKMLTTEMAWAVYERMEDVYFCVTEMLERARQQPVAHGVAKFIPMNYDGMLTLDGARVWTLTMAALEFCEPRSSIYHLMKSRPEQFKRPADWFVTNCKQLSRLKMENARYFSNAICLVTESGMQKMRQLLEVRQLAPPRLPIEVNDIRLKMQSAAASLQAVAMVFDDF